jgi:hypothetical protein
VGVTKLPLSLLLLPSLAVKKVKVRCTYPPTPVGYAYDCRYLCQYDMALEVHQAAYSKGFIQSVGRQINLLDFDSKLYTTLDVEYSSVI